MPVTEVATPLSASSRSEVKAGSQDSSGRIDLDDGSRIDFTGVETLIW